MRTFSAGQKIDDRYILKREIARGGGGVVFEAEQRFTTRQVALKLLLEDEERGSAAAMRLLREARALTVARHKNVVEVLDAGISKEAGPYLVLELLDGRALDGILATREKLSPADACWTVAQVAAGAAKLHRHGLVHRDIKPSNVFVRYTRDGEEAITLLDFGAATHESVPRKERITVENSLVGTPEYMSPEQLLGEIKPDPRMDVYALGVLLYECLLGNVPYQGTYGEILLGVHSGAPRILQEEFERLPTELCQILSHATAIAADRRTPTATQLADELNAVLGKMPASPGSLLGLTDAGENSYARRRQTRVPYTTAATIHTSDGHTFKGRTQDLSTGGTLVLTAEPFNTSNVTELELALPSGGAPVRVPVTCKWSRASRKGMVSGLEFYDLPEAILEDIRSYVAAMVERGRHESSEPTSGLTVAGTTTLVG